MAKTQNNKIKLKKKTKTEFIKIKANSKYILNMYAKITLWLAFPQCVKYCANIKFEQDSIWIHPHLKCKN